jgi:D-arabinose 1-dehydrogenase-like Zn-dependent alcohol dehydrogenase
MKAAVFASPNEELALSDVDVKESHLEGVAVRVDSCGICHSGISILDLGADGRFPVIIIAFG